MSMNNTPTAARKPGVPARARAVASLLALALLAGCAGAAPAESLDASTLDSSPFGPPQVPSAFLENDQDDGTKAATPSATASSATPSPDIDTSGWKQFDTQGLGFLYPGDWRIEEDDCSDCNSTAKAKSDPYAKWDIETSDGDEIAEFRADSATDTDGDTATYSRTVLESIPVDGGLEAPAQVLFEHRVIRSPGKKTEEKVSLMVIDSVAAQERDGRPALDFFTSHNGFSSQFASTDDLAEELGFDDDHVSLEDARKIMKSREYRQLRAIMLSVRVQK